MQTPYKDLECKGYSQSVTESKAIVRSIKLHQSDQNAERLILEVKIKGIKSLQLAEGATNTLVSDK